MPITILITPIIFCLSILAENNGMASKVTNRTFVFLMASWYPGLGASEIPFTLSKLTAKAKPAQMMAAGKKNLNLTL